MHVLKSRATRSVVALGLFVLVSVALAHASALSAAETKAAPAKLDATVETLKNGLKVILMEDHSVPVVSRWTFYRVGGQNERPGITGISHFIEHMMFNGAAKYGPKEFDRILESNGGYSNAFTSEDMTAYYEDFASDVLELCIDLDSDRMKSLTLDPKFVVSEMGVVKEERRLSVDNSVEGAMYEELGALAYKAHPYGWPVIGWMSDLEKITRDDAVDYWKTYYAPNNAILVIVGDFETKKALELVHTYYDSVPSQAPPEPVRTVEPEQPGERRAEVRKPAEMPQILVGYHIPEVTSNDIYALDVLQYVLSEGESSRLYKKLVRDLGIAVYAGANASWNIAPALFTFDVKVRPDKTAAECEAAVYGDSRGRRGERHHARRAREGAEPGVRELLPQHADGEREGPQDRHVRNLLRRFQRDPQSPGPLPRRHGGRREARRRHLFRAEEPQRRNARARGLITEGKTI